jgi:hypothetical protein
MKMKMKKKKKKKKKKKRTFSWRSFKCRRQHCRIRHIDDK